MKSVLDDDKGKPILFVGDDSDDAEAQKRGYAILCACKDGPVGHRSVLQYKTLGAPKDKDYYFVTRGKRMALNLVDLDDPNYIQEAAIFPGLKFIYKHIMAGDKVLVHCNSGHSRGPTMAMMFLRTVGELPSNFVTSERVFKSLYPKYDPASGMRSFARAHWGMLKENCYGNANR